MSSISTPTIRLAALPTDNLPSNSTRTAIAVGTETRKRLTEICNETGINQMRLADYLLNLAMDSVVLYSAVDAAEKVNEV